MLNWIKRKIGWSFVPVVPTYGVSKPTACDNMKSQLTTTNVDVPIKIGFNRYRVHLKAPIIEGYPTPDELGKDFNGDLSIEIDGISIDEEDGLKLKLTNHNGYCNTEAYLAELELNSTHEGLKNLLKNRKVNYKIIWNRHVIHGNVLCNFKEILYEGVMYDSSVTRWIFKDTDSVQLLIAAIMAVGIWLNVLIWLVTDTITIT